MAMSLSSEEKEANMFAAYSHMKHYSTTEWANDFIRDLNLAYQPNTTSYYLGLNFQKNKDFNRTFNIKTDL